MVTIMLTNGFGSPVTIGANTKLSSCSSCIVNINNQVPPQTILDGQTANLSFYLTSGSISDAGSKFKSDISLEYQIGPVTLNHIRTGSLVVKVPQSAGPVVVIPPPTCTINTASWDITSANQGQPVGMTIVTSNCIGLTMNFEVWEQDISPDPDDAATVNPSPVTITTNTVAKTWTAEWQDDCAGACNPPEWYFRAYIASNPSNSITSAANLNTFIPTVVNIAPSNDATVIESFPSSNFGTSCCLLDVQDSSTAKRYTLLKFNVNVPGTITNVKLNIKSANTQTCNVVSPNKCVQVWSSPGSSWIEATVTWNTKPLPGSLLQSIEDILTINTVYAFDLGTAVTNGADNTYILVQSNGGAADFIQFYNRENAASNTYLEVTYI